MSEDSELPFVLIIKRIFSIPPKKLLAISFGVFLVLLIVSSFVFGWSQHAWKDVFDKKPVKKSYGYTLTPPKGWVKLKPPPQGASVGFATPEDDVDGTNTLHAYIAVQTSTLNSSGKKLTFKQIENAYVSRLSQGVANYRLIKSEGVYIEHVPALLIEYTFSQDHAEVTDETLLMSDHGVLYDVSGESLTSAWQQHAKDINTALLSFRP